ncbi:MAG: zinc-binding dehydrogenase [Holophagaceae bacterium]
MNRRAWVIREHGTLGSPRLEDVPVGSLPNGYVRIQLKCFGLNHLDLWTTLGLPAIQLPLPIILGSDGSGVIQEVGSPNPLPFGLKIGSSVMIAPGLSCGLCFECRSDNDMLCSSYQVMGHHTNGTASTTFDVPVQNILPIPSGWTFEEAAAFPLVFLTAWEMLVEKAHLAFGQTVLIWGGGSGVGTAAIQLVKMFGGKSIVVVGDDQKAVRCWDLGATHVINRHRENVLDKSREITHNRGVDIVLEHPGPATWATSMRACRKGGQIVTCGSTTGPDVSLNLRSLFARQILIHGSYMGKRSNLFKLLACLETANAGAPLKPIVDKVFDFNDYPQAQLYLGAGHHFGKVICRVSNTSVIN